MTDTELLAWATEEMARQLAEDLQRDRVCSVCGAVTSGHWDTCWNCDKPVCEACMVETADAIFCPTCPHELAF